MSQAFFILLLILLSILRPFISLIVVVLRGVVPFFRKRLDFERINFSDEASRPFLKRHAHYCFEVSSEGELEQVRALIEAALLDHRKIEIIYSSPSVEVKCQLLYKNYPDQVRLLRLPLLSSFPFNFLYFKSVWFWVKAPVVVFCRYDFFPELLLLKLFGKKFVLVSGAFKKTSWYKLQSFKLFDVIVAATEAEKNNFSKLVSPKTKLYACDFRVPRIADRFLHAEETLAKRDLLSHYIEKLKSIPRDQKIILGSAWLSDMQILNNPKLIERVKSGKIHLLIAPHKLDDEFTKALEKKCQEIFGKKNVAVVNEENPYIDENVVILQMGGILCELYSLFSASYVGGGYERSIHSVLEPFFSNNMIVTGPAIKRSTEFDLAHEIAPSEIHVLNNPESFYTIIESASLTNLDISARENFKARTEQEMKLIIQEVFESMTIG